AQAPMPGDGRWVRPAERRLVEGVAAPGGATVVHGRSEAPASLVGRADEDHAGEAGLHALLDGLDGPEIHVLAQVLPDAGGGGGELERGAAGPVVLVSLLARILERIRIGLVAGGPHQAGHRYVRVA